MGQFFGDFVDALGVFSEFNVQPQGEILAAVYDGGYDGSAEVLWRGDDGLLYEIHGSHCSCFGLEDQWTPELVQVDELRERMRRNNTEYSRCVLALLPPIPEA